MVVSKKRQGRVFDVVNILKQKVGFGSFDPADVKKAQGQIDDYEAHPELFEELAMPALAHMKKLIDSHEAGKLQSADALSTPVLDLKANGAMFGYKAVTAISSDILDIMQNSDEINADLIDLYRSLYLSIKTILDNHISDESDRNVLHFDMEIGRACTRYRKKYGLESRIFKK